MIVRAVKTGLVLPGATSIEQILDEAIPSLNEGSIVAVTSKIVSLCENQVLPVAGNDRSELIRSEAELYYAPPPDGGNYDYIFSITHSTLIPASGIDLSNGNGNYILWPQDPQASANAIRTYLKERFGLKQVGVIVTDSAIGLSRWGTVGIALSHSGFSAVRSYIGQPDLFGRTLSYSDANVAGGLAAAAVVVMGEGAEQTPLAVLEDLTGVEFQDREPTAAELAAYYISPLDDEPFKPFFGPIEWQRGGKFKEQ